MKRFFIIPVLLTCCLFTGLFAQPIKTDRGTVVAPQAIPTFRNIYALVVGISDYQHDDVGDLEFADDDARLFYTYLLAAYPQQIKPGTNIQLLLNKEANAGAIEEKLKWLRREAGENDLVIFFFAGHGGIDTDFGDAYLLPYNSVKSALNSSGAITVSHLDKVLNDHIATEKRATTICILDACHSGKSTSNKNEYADRINTRLSQQQANVIKLLASRGSQVAIEEASLCGGHGWFTYFLIKGLLKEADTNKDGKISLTEIETFLPTNVRNATSNRQNPVIQYDKDLALNGWQGENSDEFICLLGNKSKTAAITYATFDERALINTQLKENQKRHYDQFTKALAEQRFIEPSGNNALYFYELLREDRVELSLLSQIRGQWKARFQDYGQGLIIEYVQERFITRYTDYERAAQMMQKVLDDSSPSDEGYKLLKAKQIWLANYALSRKIQMGVFRNSQNEQAQMRRGIVAKMKEAITLDPQAAYLYNTLGFNLERVGSMKEAEAAYRKAIELAPRWTYPRNNLSLIVPDLDQKISILEECIEINPEMFLAYGNLAKKYLVKDDTLRCRQLLDKALELCIRNKDDLFDLAWLYQQYAELYKKRGDRQRAEYYYKKAVDNSDPNDIDSRLTLADYYSEIYETNKVDAFLTGVQEQWSKDARIYSSWGYKSFKIADWKNAAAQYRQAVERDSANDYYHYMLSVTYRQLKQYDLALQHTTTSLRLKPDDHDYLSELGNIWSEQDQYDKAIMYHRKALELNPKSASINSNLAYVYLRKKDYSEAERLFREAIRLSNREYAYYFKDLGYALYLQKKSKEALTEYRKALRITPAWNEVWASIGDVYQSMDQLDSAVFYLNRGIELNAQIAARKYKEAHDQFLSTIRQADNIYSYYALGYLHEKGYGTPVNLTEAARWYAYAVQLGSSIASQKLIRMYENKQIRIDNPTAEIERLRKNIAKGRKRFTIPAQLKDGNKIPVDLIVEDFPPDPNEPIAHELRRIREIRNATIAPEVIDSFGKLYVLATKNNVSFQDLSVYALQAANEEKAKISARSINYPAKALDAIRNNRLDSLNTYMRQSVLTYLRVNLEKPEEAAKQLLDSLRNGTDQPGLMYYALGYLYEHKPSGRAWAKAETYYRYAFQTGYAPAYFRLLNRYTREIASTSQANWLRDNYNRGVGSFSVSTYLPDSTSRKRIIYIHDFPQDSQDPIADERQRFQDVFGASLSPSLVQRFRELYNESITRRRSFREQCDLAVNSSSPTTSSENNSVTVTIQEADALLEKGKYDQAITLYLDGIKKTTSVSQRAEYWVKTGNAFMAKGDFKMSQWAYQLSLSLQPSAWAFYCSGYSYSLQPKKDSAIIRYRQAIELNPSRAVYHRELGRNLYDLKEYTSAIKALTRSRELDSTNTQTLNSLGIALTANKRFAEGLACFRQATELNPSGVGLYTYNIACNYALQGKEPEALKYLEEAIKLKYDDYNSISQDPDFTQLRKTEGYKKLMAKYFPTKKE